MRPKTVHIPFPWYFGFLPPANNSCSENKNKAVAIILIDFDSLYHLNDLGELMDAVFYSPAY